MRRRDFLGKAASAAIGMSAASPAAQAVPSVLAAGRRCRASFLADRLLQAYPLPRSLATIGLAARQDPAAAGRPCPTCLTSAVREFLGYLGWPEGELMQMSPVAILERIKTGTARDFSRGRTVLVQGWLLGETEVRLCAVAALREV